MENDRGMQLRVHVMQDERKLSEMSVHIGTGAQSVRWLSLVVAQRFVQQHAPHGRQRCRERDHVSSYRFFTPSAVYGTDGRQLSPQTMLSSAFADGDIVRMQVAANFDARWRPSAKTNELGSPSLSRFHQRAFHNSDVAKKLRGGDTGCNRALVPSAAATQRHLLQRRYESMVADEVKADVQRRREGLQKKDAATFRSLMSSQMVFMDTFGPNANVAEEVSLVVSTDMQAMKLLTIEPDADEQGRIRDIFAQHFVQLNSLFKHYSGYDSRGSVGCMSFTEFCHLLHHCELFNQFEARTLLKKVFKEANLEIDGLRTGKTLLNDDKNPDLEFVRYEFLEALLRLALVKFKGVSSSEALSQFLDKLVSPAMIQRLETPVARGLQEQATQSMLFSAIPRLLAVYKRYSVCDGYGHERPTMSVQEFTELLYDAGIAVSAQQSHQQRPDELAGSNGNTRPPLSHREVRTAFSGSQADVSFGADDVTESEEMVFPEFIEALARCAINRWEDVPGLTFRDKLSLAIEQVCELAHRPVANPKLPNRMKRAATERAGVRPSAIEMPSPLKAAGRSMLA